MIPLLDTHQHLIYRDNVGYGWTEGIPALEKGNFTLEDYVRITVDAGVGGTLFMETGVDDQDYKSETRLVSELSQDPARGVVGLIASIRPESDDGFDAWLEESSECGAVGYRRVLHVIDDAMSQTDTFRKNVRRIGEAGKVFDMCFLARQLPLAAELARACDNTKLVLNHCGVPDIAGNDLDPWRADMSALAALPNVFCKVSGIMAYCAPGEATLDAIGPYVDHVLEAFGPSRVVWGSDWPVVNMAEGLLAWIAATRTILGKLSADEAAAIAHRNAVTVYRVGLPSR